MTSIPLQCSVCPKAPKFSDVSHLLTHIASKGHLSHYYKVKVRSGSEEPARKLIQSYDRWYAEWNVEDLMSERMHLKEKRRSRPRASAASHSSRPIKKERETRSKGFNSTTSLDPRLSMNPAIKNEARATPPLSSLYPAPFQHPNAAPPMSLWPTTRRAPILTRTSGRRTLRAPLSSPPKSYYPSGGYGAPRTEAADDEEGVSECTRLKGVCWPGMAIFDSATPEMKRKRNQKKDTSVVEQLEANSLDVEASEVVWTPRGSYKKTRKISGLVEDDTSPIKMSSSPQKSYGMRQALAPLPSNTSRGINGFGGQFLFARPLPMPLPNYSTAFFEDDQMETQLTYGTYGRRKRAFDVFEDQEEISFGHPAGFTLLNSEFHYHPPPEPSPFDSKPFGDPFAFDDMENFDHVSHYHADDCIEGLAMQHDHFAEAHHTHDAFGHEDLLGTYKGEADDFDDERTVTAPASEVQ